MRINVTQIKVGMTMYYLNNIYIGGEKNQREVLRKWKKERENERKSFSFFFSGCSYMGCKKPFIGFIIWTPITHLKDE